MDPIVQDARPADSSPAAAPTPVDQADPLDRLSAPDLQTWRETGKLPDQKVVASTAGTPPAAAVEDQPVSTETPAQAASEVADPDLKPKTKARMAELLAQRAAADERAARAEKRARELEARPHAQPPPDARPAASSAAPAGLVKPDPAAYDYGTADPAYLEALTDYKVNATLAAERATWEEGQRQTRARTESARVIEAFDGQVAAARSVHPDFDTVALQAPTLIPPGSLADLFILENRPDTHGAGGAEVLYHLQKPENLAEQRRILALPLMDQMIALVRLGDRLKAGAPASSTHAPPPPPTLQTRATPGDPVERALANDDTGAYIRAMNARELARKR